MHYVVVQSFRTDCNWLHFLFLLYLDMIIRVTLHCCTRWFCEHPTWCPSWDSQRVGCTACTSFMSAAWHSTACDWVVSLEAAATAWLRFTPTYNCCYRYLLPPRQVPTRMCLSSRQVDHVGVLYSGSHAPAAPCCDTLCLRVDSWQ